MSSFVIVVDPDGCLMKPTNEALKQTGHANEVTARR